MRTQLVRSSGLVLLVPLVLAASLVACSGADPDVLSNDSPTVPGAPPGVIPPGADGGAGGAPTTTGLPCDVDAVLKARCQTCHGAQPKYGASAALVTWDDLHAPAPKDPSKRVFELVRERVHADAAPMPPSPQPRLTPAESAALDTWIDGGAVRSGATCTNEAPKDGVKKLSCAPDTKLLPSKPFVMQANAPTDQYVCFGVDVNLAKKRHVTALAPKVDNAKIVHHILLFQTNRAEPQEPFACPAFGSAAWRLVAGWAPGGDNLELPPEAGFPEETGTTHWVVQVHYNSAGNATGQMDRSGYELCTTETLRANDAGVLAFGSVNFSIPPRSTKTIRCDYRLGAQFKNTKLFNASPHMHTLGVSMSTERLVNGAGTPEMIFEQKAFSFEAQANFPIQKQVTAGDVMRTRCTWKNPTDATVGFGEGTADEMCFDFLGYYPRIPDQTLLGIPLFTWVTPSSNATCVTE